MVTGISTQASSLIWTRPWLTKILIRSSRGQRLGLQRPYSAPAYSGHPELGKDPVVLDAPWAAKEDSGMLSVASEVLWAELSVQLVQTQECRQA